MAGKTPRSFPSKARGTFCWEVCQDFSFERRAGSPQRRASFLAAATMVIPCPILVGSPKERPLADEGSRGGRRKDQMSKQMMGFGGSQRDEWGAGCGLGLRRSHEVLVNRDADEEGICQQDEGQMPIPAEVAAHFILIESQSFGGFQVLFDAPACPNGLHHGGQRGLWWRKDEKGSQLIWVVQTAADDEEMATVDGTSTHNGQTSPVKEALAFGTKTDAERRCQSRACSSCRARLPTSASLMPARVCTHTTSMEGTAKA